MSSVARLFVVLAATMLMASCALEPERHALDMNIAAAGSTARASLSNDKWWLSFEDERLSWLVEAVLGVNSNLALAGLRLKQARLIARLADDDLQPHLDASLSSDYDKYLKQGSPWRRTHSALTTVSYEIDLWGKLRGQRQVAEWEAQATAQDLESTALALVNDTCSLYWTLAFLNQRIATGEKSIDRLNRTLSLVQTQFDSGAVSRLELREAEQNVQSQLAQQSTVAQQRVETRNALSVLLDGHPWPQSDEPQNLDSARSPGINAGVSAELVARRPDLRAAELRLRESLRMVDVARASYYPAISLTSSIGGSSSELGKVLTDPIGSLGAGLVLPFLRWNQMRLNTTLAAADYEIAAVAFRDTLHRAFAEVDSVLSARLALAEQLEFSQKSFDASVDVERLYEVRYRAGAAPLRSWLDAQETRRAAELSLAQVHLNQLQTDSLLFQALGGGV